MAHWMQDSMLPTKPLLDVIARKTTYHGSLNELARNICHRMNLSAKDCATVLAKLKRKEKLSMFAVDRYLTAMGYHLIEVYGFSVYAQGVDLSDVMTQEECC